MERLNAQELSSEEIAHLETLKSFIEKALEDGQFLAADIDRIKSITWAHGKVTYEELCTILDTIHAVMGEAEPSLGRVIN